MSHSRLLRALEDWVPDDLRLFARDIVAHRRSATPSSVAIDDAALVAAVRLAASQPRCDYTIDQLPVAGTLLATDEFPLFRGGGVPGGGQTYKGLLGLLMGGTALPWFYVGNFQAPTDGVTDAWPSITNAIAAATANGGGTVLLGPYNYSVSQMLVVNGANVNIQGMGQGTSTIVQNFSPSAANPAILMNAANGTSTEYSGFSLQGPGVSATGSVPGPTTPSAPALGTGWGFLNFGGSQVKVSYVSTNGIFHGFGAIIFGTTGFQNCVAGMGGIQQSTQYGFYAQGPAGAAATGTITISLSPAPVQGDTITGVFDDGQGNVITVPAYTVTSADAGNPTPANAVAISYANWLNNSDIVIGFNANWNPCVASGNTIALSIMVPLSATTPTYQMSSTGTTVISPTSLTAVVGGSRLKNPVSQVFGVKDCTVPQAQYSPSKGVSFASTEGVHIDGGVTTAGISNFGTTGVQYGIRFANVNSGSDAPPKLLDINTCSFDHSHFCSISHESGSEVRISNIHIIANFGAGPPPTSAAINIAPTANGADIFGGTISQCESAGIFLGSGNVNILGMRIQQVGRRYLSPINLIGSNAIIGVTVKDCKFGAADLSNGGQGANSYAIDLAGPGSPTVFTGTVQSLTVVNNDVTGIAGAINRGTIISGSITAFGLDAYITIDNNPGDFPLLDVAQPMPVNVAGVYSVINPFVSRRSVLLVPDGSHAITSYVLTNSDGATTLSPTLGNGVPITVSVGPNESLMVHGTTGWSMTWFWS